LHQRALRSFDADNFHDFNFHPGYLFKLQIIRDIDSSTFQTSVALLSSISKRDVIPIQHYRIEHPTICFSLDVAHYSGHLEVIELAISLQELIYV
jgi:hypothetical protein